MIRISNCRAVQPFVEVVNKTVPVLASPAPRQANIFEEVLNAASTINLPWPVLSPDWIEVYIDGFRLVNTTLDFGNTYTGYTVSDQLVQFTIPITGNIKIICDTTICPFIAEEYVVSVDNQQGADVTNTRPGDLYAATFCEPVVLTQPLNGYARLTDDRKEILYVPDQGFVGKDAFSYSVTTQRGQLAEPKCVYMTVGTSVPEE